MKILSVLFISLVLINPLLASESNDTPLTFKLKIGEEYNSNLTVEELDIDSSESGLLTNIELLADYNLKLENSAQLRFGYEFSQSLHDEFDEFDTQSHSLSAGYEKESGQYIFSADYIFYDTTLDSNSLMDMHFFMPGISYMVNDNFLVRADYSYIDKTFDEFTERSAVSNGAGISAYYFFNEASSYLRYAFSGNTEDAISDELDYSSYSASFSVKTPAKWVTDNAAFKASVSYSDRDYDHITVEIDERRAEQRTQFKTSIVAPINETIEIEGAYEFIDRVSNLEIADYKENRVMLSIEFNF